ncbi:MBL fold metallo-hydrolase [Pseudothermotoga sp.]|nr:MBL fold metallo-hydrolase [Pseudothermotoga sp.]MCX7813604.1 MBL fold metallo-hydrolase [Pseudothermotoga sp.]MDW8139992.1 MBL fold metallo-hydrolase [Pseudothermotoga sp.]
MKFEVLITGGSIRVPPYVAAPYCTVALLSDEKRMVLIEPGSFPAWEALERSFKEKGLKAEDITDLVISHVHMDHIFCSIFFKNAVVHVHEKYIERNYSSFGPIAGLFYPMVLNSWKEVHPIKDGDVLFDCVKVFHTPYHSSDHVSLLIQTENMGRVFMPGDICYSRIEYFEYMKGYKKDDVAKFLKTISKDCDWIVFTHDLPMKVVG